MSILGGIRQRAREASAGLRDLQQELASIEQAQAEHFAALESNTAQVAETYNALEQLDHLAAQALGKANELALTRQAIEAIFDPITGAQTAVEALDRLVAQTVPTNTDRLLQMKAAIDGVAAGGAAILSDIQQGLGLIEAGAIRMDGLLQRLHGDVKTIGKEWGTVASEFFKLDVRGKEQEIQEMLVALRTGNGELKALLDTISAGGNQLGTLIKNATEAFKQQKISVDQFVQQLRDYGELVDVAGGPNSALSAVLSELEQQARRGNL